MKYSILTIALGLSIGCSVLKPSKINRKTGGQGEDTQEVAKVEEAKSDAGPLALGNFKERTLRTFGQHVAAVAKGLGIDIASFINKAELYRESYPLTANISKANIHASAWLSATAVSAAACDAFDAGQSEKKEPLDLMEHLAKRFFISDAERSKALKVGEDLIAEANSDNEARRLICVLYASSTLFY